MNRAREPPRPPGNRLRMRVLPSVPVSNGCRTAGRDWPPTVRRRASARGGPRLRRGGHRRRTQGQRETSGRVRRRRWIHERRAVPVEHRPEEFFDELLLLFRSGDEALMRQQSVRQTVGPVQRRELLHRRQRDRCAATPRRDSRCPRQRGPGSSHGWARGMPHRRLRPGGRGRVRRSGPPGGRPATSRVVVHYSGSMASASARRGSTSRGRTTDAASAAWVASS